MRSLTYCICDVSCAKWACVSVVGGPVGPVIKYIFREAAAVATAAVAPTTLSTSDRSIHDDYDILEKLGR